MGKNENPLSKILEIEQRLGRAVNIFQDLIIRIGSNWLNSAQRRVKRHLIVTLFSFLSFFAFLHPGFPMLQPYGNTFVHTY
jgi:hypothetical protein